MPSITYNSVNPITLHDTGFPLPEGVMPILFGRYQNAVLRPVPSRSTPTPLSDEAIPAWIFEGNCWRCSKCGYTVPDYSGIAAPERCEDCEELQGRVGTPLSDEAIRQYPVFTEGVHARLIAGRETYGDISFERPVAEFLDELQQECMDLSGWGFILWGKIEKMKLEARSTQKACVCETCQKMRLLANGGAR